MIHYQTGNLLDADVEALVNTVNTVGIMGKGLALAFKERFAHNYALYRKACQNGQVQTGHMFLTELAQPELGRDRLRYIINFPTKQHWKARSKMNFITQGLADLRQVLVERNIGSVAIPPLGSGNGGLDWQAVKIEIETALHDLDVDIIVYEPSTQAASQMAKAPNLTPIRAGMLSLLKQFTLVQERPSLVAANKIAYFMQRFGQPEMGLSFKKHHYGPYEVKVGHMLYHLNGYFIEGLHQKQAKPFDYLDLLDEHWQQVDTYLHNSLPEQDRSRFEHIASFLTGFETTFDLELLASIDWLIDKEKVPAVAEPILAKLQAWTPRKARLFDETSVEIALERLLAYRQILYPVTA